MKAIYHIPTEPYGFVELEGKVDSISEALTEYQNAKFHRGILDTMQTEGGLNPKEWRAAIDRYLGAKELKIEEYERMSPFQRAIINEIKKSYNRDERER